jgi:hypothetical protein
MVAQTPNTASDSPQPSAATLIIALPQSIEGCSPTAPGTPEPADLLQHLIRQRQLDTELLALRAVRLRLLALELLESAAAETKDPIDKRKLAIAITRATSLRGLVGAAPAAPGDPDPFRLPPPEAPRSGQHDPGATRSAKADPSLARPRRTPKPDDCPEHIISALGASLQKPSDPDPGSDIATLRTHMAPDATFNGAPIPGSAADFADTFNQSPLAAAREFQEWNTRETSDPPGNPDSRSFFCYARNPSTGAARISLTLTRTSAPRGDPAPPPTPTPAWLITNITAQRA